MTFKPHFVGYAAWLAVACLALFAYLNPPKLLPSSKASEKTFEMNNNTISGYENQKKVWEVSTTYVWAPMGQSEYIAEKGGEAKVWNSAGQLILSHVKAPQIKVNMMLKQVVALNGVSGTLHPKFLLEKRTDSADMLFTADQMNYTDVIKTAYLLGKIELVQNKKKLMPHIELLILTEQKVAKALQGFVYQSPEWVLQGQTLNIFFEQESAFASGNVIGIKQAQSANTLTGIDEREKNLRKKVISTRSDHFILLEKPYSSVKMLGQVLINQGVDWKINADNASYDSKEGVFKVEGNVSFELKQLLPWVKKQNAEKAKKISKYLTSLTTGSCDFLSLDKTKKVLTLTGDVEINQPQLNIECESLEYNDFTEILILKEVQIKKQGGAFWKCDVLIYNLKKETTHMTGIKDSEFSSNEND